MSWSDSPSSAVLTIGGLWRFSPNKPLKANGGVNVGRARSGSCFGIPVVEVSLVLLIIVVAARWGGSLHLPTHHIIRDCGARGRRSSFAGLAQAGYLAKPENEISMGEYQAIDRATDARQATGLEQ